MARPKKQNVNLPGGASVPSRFITVQYQKPKALYFDANGKFTSKDKAQSVKYIEPKPVYRDQYGKRLTEAEAKAKKVKQITLDREGKVRAAKKSKARKREPVIEYYYIN
jgi:hypothetical protein